MIDNFIVAFYLLLTLGIGIYYRSKTSGFKGFTSVKDSSKKNRLLLLATIFVSSVGGGTSFGLSEKAFLGDVSYAYGLLITITIDLLVAKFVIPRLIKKHYGTESVGDIMAHYYGPVGRFIAGVAAVTVSVGFLAAQISVSGRIFQYILDIGYIEGVVFSYGIIICYTTIGGLRSVLFTNLLQFFAMILAIPVIAVTGTYIIGVSNLAVQLPMDKLVFSSTTPLLTNTISAALGFAVMGMYPNFIQRALINNNPSDTSRAIYIKSVIYAVFIVLITLNGLIGYILFPNQPSNLALPYLIDQIIPSGLKGIVVTGLLAAVMSTADSDLNVTSISLVKDIFNPFWKERNQEKLLLVARITNIAIGSVAILIALRFASVVDLVIFVAGFWGPMILVPLVFALFDVTLPLRFMVFSSISGLCSFLLWENYLMVDYLELKGVFVGTMVSLVTFLAPLAFRKRNR